MANGLLSLSKEESFSLVMLEAAYLGIPTVSFATGMAKSFIKEGMGKVVERFDVDEMAIHDLRDGRILVTSWADSSVQVIANGAFRKVIGNVAGPADIGVDTKRNVVAVPRFEAGRVEYFTIVP